MKKYLALLIVLLFATVSFAKPIGGPPPPKTGLKTYTVATIPSASANTNMAIIVTDGNTDTDCETTGGGTTRNVCVSDGTNWVISGDGNASGAVEDDVYGSGWNADTTHAPSQNAIYDIIHQYDTDDDGDIDSLDGEADGGDITGVGPGGTGAGDALTDGYVTQNTTSMFIWEGTTDDAVEYHFVLPAADPITADTTYTYPASTGTFIVGEAAHADNTILTIDGTGSLTQETGVTIDDSENMAGIGTLGVTGVITSADATEASATTTASVKVAGGLGVVKDIWVGDDIVLDSDSTVISLGADQDIKITHTADTGITVFEGTEEILVLKDGGAGSATNEITVLSAATTASPTIQQTGEDDIGIDFETVNDEELLQLDAIAAGTNNLVIGNNANGSSPTIVAVGSSDANVGISIDAKAAGEIAIGSADAKFSVASDALDISNAGAISNAGTIGSGAITSTGTITAGAGAIQFDVTGATSITIGSADVTSITLDTADAGDGSDVVLPAGSIQTAEILDGTIAENDIAAALAFDDGDYIDLSGVTHTANTAEGLVLPTWADVAVASNVKGGTIAFDETSDSIKFKTGDGWESIAATAAPVDAQYLVASDSGTLTNDRTLAWGAGVDGTESGSPVTLTVTVDATELDAVTWSDNANASNIWTFDVSGTDHTMTAGNGVMTFGDAVTVTDALTINGNITDGTATWTSATQAMSGFSTIATTGNITSGGSFIIGSASMDETDLEKLDGITNGTQAANKAVVADANVNTGASKVTALHIGTSGSETQVTSTAAELNILDGVTSDYSELNYLDITTLGTGENSKAVTLTAAGNFTAPAGTWDMSSATGITLQADEIVDADVVDALTVTAQASSTWDVADSITALSVYTGTTSLEETTGATDSGAYIVGVYDEFTNSNSTNVQAVLNDLDGAIAASSTAYDDIGDPDASGSITFGTYTGTYTSSSSAWDGIFVSDTVTAVLAATELLTLKFDDSEGASTGQLNFLTMVANNVTLVDFDEDGLKIGTGTPTNTMDGGDVYITDDVEIDGTLTLGALVLAGSAAPVWTWNDSDAAGTATADEEAMQINANLSTITEDDEIGDWRISYMHDDGVVNANAAAQSALLWDGSAYSMMIGVLSDDYAGSDVAGYESLKFDFDTAADAEVAISSPSGATDLSVLITDLHLGVDDTIGHLKVHDAGTIVMYDNSDDTSVTIGPVTDGTTTLGITGSLDVSTSVVTNLIDTTGAADLDIGSVDVTDVTISTDGGADTLTLGTNANVDYGITFDSDTADLTILWEEDNHELEITDSGGEALVIDLDHATDQYIGIDGSASGATHLDFAAMNMVTTGTILGAMNIVTTTDGTESPTAAQMNGSFFIADHGTATSDTDYTLPTAVAGMCACFYDNGAGTGGIIIDAAASDEILLEGTGIGVAEAIDSPGVAGDGANGDFICLLAIDATYWITLGSSGTWVDGGDD